MKSVGGYVVAALALVALGTMAIGAGRFQYRLAGADEALAALDFAEASRAYSELEGSVGYARYIPWFGGDALRRIRANHAAVQYWDGDYDAVLSLAESVGGVADPELLVVTANAVYRVGRQRASDSQSLLRAVDAARAAYQVVLREHGNHPDAAFNYEYLSRVRDEIAMGDVQLSGVLPSDDELTPSAQTLHGREGGPPPDEVEEEFKVYVPRDQDEEKGTGPGADQVRERKG
jgi:hypothetical protein